MSKRTKAEINRKINELWADALKHRAAACDAYIAKLDISGYGTAETGRLRRQADRLMREHERAARECHDKVNRLGELRRELFGR